MADNSDQRNRGPGRPFVPGASPNPGGRPKKLEALKIKLSQFTEQACDRLENIATSGEDKDAVAAIKLMWSYLYGAPRQEVSGPDGGPIAFAADIARLSDAELRSIVDIAGKVAVEPSGDDGGEGGDSET